MINKNKTTHLGTFIAISILTIASCFVNSVSAATQTKNIDIALTLYNSYSGSISLVTTGYTTGGTTYLTSTWITLDISANNTSTREIMGDMLQSFTGDGVWSYVDTVNTFLIDGDGPKVVTGIYFKGIEFLYPTPLLLYIDTTPPTMPLGLTPLLNGNTYESPIIFNRSPSFDAGAGVEAYRVIYDTSPSFTSPTVYTSSITTQAVPWNLIPLGTIYRYVESIDHVGNSIAWFPLYFKHVLPPINKTWGKNTVPWFLTDPILPPEEVPQEENPEEDDTHQAWGLPWRRTPIRFARRELFPIFGVPDDSAQSAEEQKNIQDQITNEGNLQDFADDTSSQRIPIHPPKRYTKLPTYPVIVIDLTKDKPAKSESILDWLNHNQIHYLTPEQIRKLKKELAQSDNPVQDYIDEVLPYQVKVTNEDSKSTDSTVAWRHLIEIYNQLPSRPFSNQYLQVLTHQSPIIPQAMFTLWLLLLCYDIETYRMWTRIIYDPALVNKVP